MHRHLVSVEVRVERGTHQRVKLDRLAFHQDRLEGLDSQTMQGRRTVQHDRMLLDDLLEDVPHLVVQLLHHLLRALDVVGSTVCHQFLHYERFEQLDRHLLGKTALIDLQLRSHDDNRTA